MNRDYAEKIQKFHPLTCRAKYLGRQKIVLHLAPRRLVTL